MNAPLLLRSFLPSVLVLGVGLVACHSRDPQPVEVPPSATVNRHGEVVEVPAGSPLRERLKIDTAAYKSVRRSLEAPAEVEADPARLARVTPPLPGRVVQLFVRFGDQVTVGQPLYSLDSPDLVAAQTDFMKARSALAQAERTMARQEDLRKSGIGAARDVEQAQTDRDLQRTELERTTLRLKLLGMDPGSLGRPLTVRAPLTGRIVEYKVAPGEYRNDLAAPLMTIADLSMVWVTANVQEKDIRRVHTDEDAVASFAAYPGESWTGKVLFVGDLLKPETRTIQVRIAFDNEKRRLRPGMFGSVRFTENASPEICVPTTAVVLIGDASFLFVEFAGRPFVFQRRRITPGPQIEKFTAIADGLKVGERVVIENAVLLQ